MKNKIPVIMLSVMACLMTIYAEEEVAARTLERYRTIVDRMPFGEPPAGFDPENPSAGMGRGEAAAAGGEMTEQERTEEEKRLAGVVRVSVLNVTPSGKTMVGFTDTTDSKAPAHYYMAVGEERAGWTIKDADPSAEGGGSVTLSKDGIEVTLKLGEGSEGKGKGAQKQPLARHKEAPTRSVQPPTPNASAPNASAPGRPAAGGLAALRERRAQQLREQAANRAAAEKAESARKEEEARRKEEAEREKAEQEAAREEQRQQLRQIQEELKRQREENEKKKAEEAEKEPEKDTASTESE